MASPNIEEVLFAVQRNGVTSSCKGIDLKDKLEDGDLLAVTRGSVTYKLEVEIPPWEGHPGGIWHVKNATEVMELYAGPYTGWSKADDFKNEVQIKFINPGEEVVFVTGTKPIRLFLYNRGTWDFGEYTDTSEVTDFSQLFDQCAEFNGTLGGNWDTSKVTEAFMMCFQASAFNQDISGWDMSSVEDMDNMFAEATSFNQPIGSWDTSNVTYMGGIFLDAHDFNQDISGWDISNVGNLSDVFRNAKSFDKPLSWKVSNVYSMDKMFHGAKSFNQDISGWDTSSVESMDDMFKNAESFNQNLGDWCVTEIPDEPDGFDNGATAWTKDKPCWGHCPPDDPCPPPGPILDSGLDPDGNKLNDNLLVVFECLTDVTFNPGKGEWESQYWMPIWKNDRDVVISTPSRETLKQGDIVKIRVRPSDFKNNTSYELEDALWTPLQLKTGRIQILPETDISYLTDENIKVFSTSYQPACLFGQQQVPSDRMAIVGLEHIRLGPNLSNNNNKFYILGYRNVARVKTLHDLSKCRNPYAPILKPIFKPLAGTLDLFTIATYGLIVNTDYAEGVNVTIPDWDTYREA